MMDLHDIPWDGIDFGKTCWTVLFFLFSFTQPSSMMTVGVLVTRYDGRRGSRAPTFAGDMLAR